MQSSKKALLSVRNLKKWFPVSNKKFAKAVDDVSFDIYIGETLGLVGESGCGKTTMSRVILGLEKATDGSVKFDGEELIGLNGVERRKLSTRIQMVFQDPFSSLNPTMKVGEIINEPLLLNKIGTRKERKARVNELMEIVGLPLDAANRLPHSFSGGQRQRICIARALAANPDFLICDEPVSALDVSIRSQILNLILYLKKKFALTTLFISHDLSVVEYVCDRVVVMYLGRIMEIAPCDELYKNAAHPYTKALISAIPMPNPEIKPTPEILDGDIPSPLSPPSGCRFRTRCKYASEECKIEQELIELGNGHLCACHLAKNGGRGE